MTGKNTVIELLDKHYILLFADLVVAGIVSDLISHPSDVFQHFVVGFPTGNAILSVESFCFHLGNILADTVLARVYFRTEFIKMFVFLEKGVICCLQVVHRLSCTIIVPHHAKNRKKKVDETDLSIQKLSKRSRRSGFQNKAAERNLRRLLWVINYQSWQNTRTLPSVRRSLSLPIVTFFHSVLVPA